MLSMYDGSKYRRGLSNLARTSSLPGTEIPPVEVDASTKRRQRHGYWWANCCASPPPHEIPSTSTCWCPNSSSICATSRARPRKRIGKRGSGDPPTPGISKQIVPIFCPSTLSSASRKGLYVLLPGDAGAAFCEPERASSHAFQCSHQLPFCFVAPSNQVFASADRSLLVKNVAFGLPAGLRMLWV